jgi:hypothetical protein
MFALSHRGRLLSAGSCRLPGLTLDSRHLGAAEPHPDPTFLKRLTERLEISSFTISGLIRRPCG